ncbi:unnamed protein product [Ectocarpus sp. CCAP 1310/34]|nr:unnamed protein product [Ectocarpus sp. CCAP 1310/34]
MASTGGSSESEASPDYRRSPAGSRTSPRTPRPKPLDEAFDYSSGRRGRGAARSLLGTAADPLDLDSSLDSAHASGVGHDSARQHEDSRAGRERRRRRKRGRRRKRERRTNRESSSTKKRKYEDDDTSSGDGSDRLFVREGVRQLVWMVLTEVNPWRQRQRAQLGKAWERCADKVVKKSKLKISTHQGEKTVRVDVARGQAF